MIADTIARWLADSDPVRIPDPTAAVARALLVDVAGLCVAVGLGLYYADFIARGGLD